MSFQPLGTLVKKSVNKNGLYTAIQSAKAVDRAADFLVQLYGEEILDTLKPTYVKYKTLHIASLNSAAAGQLGTCKKELVQYVNMEFLEPIVARVRVIS